MTSNLTQADDWREWKEKCAYQLCSEDAQARLGKFGSLRFKKYCSEGKTHKIPKGELSDLLGRLMDDPSGGSSQEHFAKQVWQHFDTSIILKKKDNKSIKDWMAARNLTLESFESEASNQFREVVREYVKIERGKPLWRTNDSLDRTLGDSDDSLTLGEMAKSDLPSPDKNLCLKELKEEVGRYFEGLSRDRQIAFAAKALNLSHDHPKVNELAGKKKSVLSSNWNGDMDALVSMLAKEESLSNVSTPLLYEFTLNAMEEIALEWVEKSENGCTDLLKVNK